MKRSKRRRGRSLGCWQRVATPGHMEPPTGNQLTKTQTRDSFVLVDPHESSQVEKHSGNLRHPFHGHSMAIPRPFHGGFWPLLGGDMTTPPSSDDGFSGRGWDPFDPNCLLPAQRRQQPDAPFKDVGVGATLCK